MISAGLVQVDLVQCKQIAHPQDALRTVAEMFSPSPPRGHACPWDSAELPPLGSQPAGSPKFIASATSIAGTIYTTYFLI